VIHGQLTRKRFRVGLMGPFQVGKSTAFNRVIGAENPADQPSAEGAGSATTAVITRLFPVPLSNSPSDAQRKIYARYLSRAQEDAKLQYLKSTTNLSTVEGDLLAAAQSKYETIEVKKQLEPIAGHPSGTKFVKGFDVKYLGLFLKSQSTYGGRANPNNQASSDGTAGLHEINWQKRKDFLNLPPEFNNADYTWNKLSPTVPPMLSSVDIYYPTDKLPEEIIFIDTPGLGSLGSVDEWLLVNHIPELDGAIVIPDAMRVMDDVAIPILQVLQRHFKRDLARRVWLVGGKADSITHRWADHSTSGFHNYRNLAEQYELDLSHVCFFCKYPESLRDRFKEIPTQLQTSGLAGLRGAWEDLLSDGGIERLRKIMKDDLASEIGESLADNCERELLELEEKLRVMID
jgi:GTPase SAR1 family protein